jgi:hypothetical protein
MGFSRVLASGVGLVTSAIVKMRVPPSRVTQHTTFRAQYGGED